MLKARLLIFSYLLSLTPAFAQSNEQSKNISAYDETLRLDIWSAYSTPELIKEFKDFIFKKYKKSIQVDVHEIHSPYDFFDRVRGNQTDIISIAHNLLQDERFNYIAKKLVIPIPATAVPNVENIEKRFIDNKFVTVDGRLYGVPMATGGYTLLYKKSAFKTPPDSWKILWDPAYQDRFAISRESYEGNMYITALTMGVQQNQMSELEFFKTKEFNDKLKTLVRNARTWRDVPIESDVRDLMLTASWCLSGSVFEDKKNEWALAYINEALPIWTDYLAVTRATNRSEFAKTLAFEWLNFMISTEVQSKLTIEKLRCYSAVPSAYSLINKSMRTRMTEESSYLFKSSIFWPLLTTRNRNGMKLIYENAFKDIEKERMQLPKNN